MIQMKRLLNCLILCAMLTGTVGCSNSITTTVESSVVDGGLENVIIDKEYQVLSFSMLPDSVTATYGGEYTDVEITGYLSSFMSNDGSTGYLWDNGYGTTPDVTDYGKCVVLDLSQISSENAVTGDQFVTITGSIVPETHYDMFNFKSEWHLKVDTIIVAKNLPDNVQEYLDFMESDEWEAYAELIDYVVNAVYSWHSDETVIIPELEILECDYSTALAETNTKYPQISSKINKHLESFGEFYTIVKTAMNDEKRPEGVDSLYENVVNTYTILSEDLVFFGNFN